MTVYARGAGMELTRVEFDTAAGTASRTYVHADRLGTVLAASDQFAPLDIWREHYSPYGEKLAAVSATDDQGGFTGHITDRAPDTSLTYMQARYYDPVASRFTSVDPVTFLGSGDPAQVGRYTYANNDPVNNFDPDGRDVFAASFDLDAAKGAGGGLTVGRYVQFNRHAPTRASVLEAVSTNIGNPIAAIVDAVTTVTETGTIVSTKVSGGIDLSLGVEFTYGTKNASDLEGGSLSVEGGAGMLSAGTNLPAFENDGSATSDPTPHSITAEISLSPPAPSATIALEKTFIIPDEKFREETD